MRCSRRCRSPRWRRNGACADETDHAARCHRIDRRFDARRRRTPSRSLRRRGARRATRMPRSSRAVPAIPAALRGALRRARCARVAATRSRATAIPTQVLAGADALVMVASLPEVDTVLAAIVGAAGLAPTLAAARAGKRILLANKEALVMGGALFMDAVDARRRDAAADRQRAQRDLPVPARALRARSGGGAACGASCSPRRAVRFARARSRRLATSRPTKRAPIRTGRWAARSRSTPRR